MHIYKCNSPSECNYNVQTFLIDVKSKNKNIQQIYIYIKKGEFGKSLKASDLTLTLTLSHWYRITKNSISLCHDPYFWIQNGNFLDTIAWLHWPMKSAWGRGHSWRTTVRPRSSMWKETSECRVRLVELNSGSDNAIKQVWKQSWEVKSQARWSCHFHDASIDLTIT